MYSTAPHADCRNRPPVRPVHDQCAEQHRQQCDGNHTRVEAHDQCRTAGYFRSEHRVDRPFREAMCDEKRCRVREPTSTSTLNNP